ncbi:NACHT domain-containing protein [Streptomyces sp. R302]|uniref:NACHT domain-containing protein n=1 Tax=unclassified Streptomyces TaxID=2593676 RepID=UPI00145EE81D|nr:MULTISPECIES: NACHT domain-containing protein [unclassified Streptomyces]NML52074.1 NACHT domain-containing protein [Streptomyces sp. R301]NML82460.1 NACHT domain-containing protein [Streptomyces sp. R302]
MEPALIGTRLASAAIGPLLRKLLAGDVPGAGLTGTDRPVRLASLLSFRGEKRTLTEKDVGKLAATLVARTCEGPGERPFPADETEAVTDALTANLLALGDLDMDDVQAVHLGHEALARRLRAAAPAPDGLSADSVHYLEAATAWACRHILEFFTTRPSFIARTLVEQTRGQAALSARLDAVAAANPGTLAEDAAFERRYLAHLAKKHGRLTIYGVDLRDAAEEWPLDVAYLSLEAAGETAGPHHDHREPHSLRADLALAAHDRVLLRGQAGSGKTTLVQWLTVSACGTPPADGMDYLHGRIPFVLPMRTLTRHGERLPDAERFLSAADCPLTPPDGWADRVLAAGRGLVLVDGIDEIPETERGRARDWLRGLLTAYGAGNRWLVTSRPTAVRDDWLARDGFTELTLSPMSPAEVATFVRRWHRAAGPAAAPYEQQLLDSLRTTEHVAELATNPLMCGLICALHHDRRGYLPRGRKPLYDAALSMLLARRDRERGMGAPYGVELDEAPQIQLVQRLAYWLTLNDRLVMDRAHAQALVTEALPAMGLTGHAPDQVFTHLLHRSGLLREPTADTVDFVHRTFQDYLAAKALVDHWDIGVLVRHATDDRWEDVIRMAVGHARPREAAEILRELLSAADAMPEGRTRLRLVLLAATALGHATEVAPEVREDILRRTGEIIPPRDPEEARELARAGRMVLDLLPGPEGLAEDTAHLVAIAATHVSADAALPFLARYADHPSLLVRAQLVWAWQRYDARAYADEVIARLDLTELRLQVLDDDRAAELLRLNLTPELLDLATSVSAQRATDVLARCDPRELRLLPSEPAPNLTPLGSLGRLEYLSLPAGIPWRTGDLPRDTPLRKLDFPNLPLDGLAGLARYPRLNELPFVALPPPALWRDLILLPQVTRLTFDIEVLARCPEDITLPSVTFLTCYGDGRGHALEDVVRVFPNLQLLHLAGGTFDVSAAGELTALEAIRTSHALLTGAGDLPSRIRVSA